MKIYITNTAPIGQKCREWAEKNLPLGATLVQNANACDLFFSIFHNKLVSKRFIIERKKCFNFHGGILPEYRGSTTINWAIINEEKETGVTLHEIDEKIDHGDIIDIQKIAIGEQDTAQSLYEKMEDIIFEMFRRWFIKLITLDYVATPQDHSKAKLYLRKDLYKAIDLTRFARAFEFAGKEQAFYLDRNGNKVHLIYSNDIMEKTSFEPEAITFSEFKKKYLEMYENLSYEFWPNKGFIVWRMSTGENAELLHVRVFVKRKGYATELVRTMIQRLAEERPPYFSVFGFALSSRTDLKEIYTHLGFKITENILPPYKGGESFIFWQTFEELKNRYLK